MPQIHQEVWLTFLAFRNLQGEAGGPYNSSFSKAYTPTLLSEPELSLWVSRNIKSIFQNKQNKTWLVFLAFFS